MLPKIVTAALALLVAVSAPADVRLSPADGANHSYPAVCRQPAGFVAAWESDGESGREVTLLELDENGRPRGFPERVNQENEGDQQLPDIACRGDGSFLVVWESRGQDGDGLGIFARDFDARNRPRGDEFRVNTHTTDNQRLPRVCVGDDGNGVIVWESFGPAAEHPRVYGQRVDATGSPAGAEFGVENVTGSVQSDPAVACGADGTFLVAWTTPTTGSGSRIRLGYFDADGAPISNGVIPETPDTVQRRHPTVANIVDGIFEGTFPLAFEANGEIQAGTITVVETFSLLITSVEEFSAAGRNEAPAIAGQELPEMFVAWSSGSVFDFSLEGARTKFGEDTGIFPVTSTQSGNHGATSPLGRGVDIANAEDGDLVVWQRRDVFADDSSSAIYSRRFRDCIGDCSDDGLVGINELITGVRIALNQAAVDTCSRIDANGSGAVEISELVRAVNEALARICPAPVN